MRIPRHRLYYSLLIGAIVLVLIAGGISLRSAREMAYTVEVADHSQAIIADIQDTLLAFGATESLGLRWAISFREDYWQGFQQSMAVLDQRAASLKARAARNPEQQRLAQSLSDAIAMRRQYGDAVYQRLREGGAAATIALIQAGRGSALNEEINGIAGQMILLERSALRERQTQMQRRLDRYSGLIGILVLLAAISGVIGVLAIIQSRRVWARHRQVELERERALAANQQKNLLLATMSHEIRTPMNAIFGFSQLLGKQTRDPKALEYIRAIRSSGQSLLALINDLLDLSKIEAGRMELHPVPTNLRELVDSTVAVFAEPAAAKALRLTSDIDPFMPQYLVLDPHRLRQVLVNLISNAIKYTEAGAVKVHLRCTQINEDGATLSIAVEDSGPGIAPDQHERIFDPFHRVPSETYQSVEGTGLGLSIVRSLTMLMGGAVSVESTPGHGSTFTVQLHKVRAAPPPKGGAEIASGDVDFAKLVPARILIVDDVPLNRELLAAYLTDAGHELAFAENGLEAVDKASLFKPTVVLMDIRMPKMDGRAAAARIRALPAGEKLCMIAVTASSLANEQNDDLSVDRDIEASVELNGEQAGEQPRTRGKFNGYLRKPVSPRDLYDCLLELIGTRRSAGQSAIDGAAQNPGSGNGSANPSASTDATLSNAQRSAARAALAELEAIVRERLPQLRSTMRMRDLRLLARDLAQIGAQGFLTPTTEFAERLDGAIEGFDLTTIDSLLDQLPGHVAAHSRQLALA